ncbi:MAG: DUF4111 domain-containing protein [Anaerolineales bacterium]|nr:DUF4111 domain-containing protein [Anaerolineales bacterium]
MSTPTPYPDVNTVLEHLLHEVQTLFGTQFVGLYLYGSLSSGDFNPASSDIDFVVVTTDPIPAELLPALETMHGRLASSGEKWAKKLEGSYMPQHALRRYDRDERFPQINEGHFFVAGHGNDWLIQRHILREQGVVVAGPAIRPFIDPVSPNDLRYAVRGVLQEWWAPMLQDASWLQRRDYQAFAVLTMCRILYTLEWGEVASKPVSAQWAMAAIEPQWTPLITRALAWPQAPQPDELAATIAFIRYTHNQSAP